MKFLKSLLPEIDPILLRLFKYVLPYKWQLFLVVICMSIVAGTTSVTSLLLGKLIDKGFYEQRTDMIVLAPIALVVITLLFALATVAGSYLLTKVSQTILAKVRTQLFSHVMRWPDEAYQKYSTGQMSSKFINEAGLALGGAVQSLMVMARDIMQVIALVALLLWQNWMLTLVAAIVGPLAAVILRIIRRRTRKLVTESQAAIADTISHVQDSYEAQRLVKVSDTYDFESAKYHRINETIRRTGLKRLKLECLSTPVTQVVTMMGVAVVVAVALLQAMQGELSVGDFITFLSAMLFLMQPLQNLAGLNATFTAVSVAGKSIFEMMDTPLQQDTGKHILKDVKGEIVFDHVCVRYPGAERDSLHDFSLRISPGDQVAFVGHSGSGKTTTVNLIPRFIEATKGSVIIDGVNVKDCTLDSLRSQITIVSQDIVLFDATIRENITYGIVNASENAILAACEAASLTEFIHSLPHGLDTRVGEAGNLLSGGQRQRVSIARAFLKNAPILILDEPTSALDSDSEQKIKEALSKLMIGRSTVIVAHRLSTIENVNNIVVMEKGNIVELGTFNELCRNCGKFANFRQLQNHI